MQRSLFRSSRLWSLLTLALIATIGLWIGCGEPLPTSGLLESTQEKSVVLSAANPQVRAVMEVQKRYTDEVMRKPGIVGTGIGMTQDGKPAIVVFAKSQALAKTAAIPNYVEDVPVIVEVTGEFKALAGPPGSGVDPTIRFDRPVPIGVSTGHPDITAGTIGCRVTDGTNVYALSNNHVYANVNLASIGDNVLQPGTYDGGVDPDDAIGQLYDFEPIKFDGSDNTIDAAIAITVTDSLGNATPSDGYGVPKSTTVAAYVNQNVMKYGRTTQFTTSRVGAINATVDVNYGDGRVARFVNQIVIRGGNFSAGGDSGSLIVANGGADDRKPVGLLFAGSSSSTIANPIDLVLTRFGVTVDGQ